MQDAWREVAKRAVQLTQMKKSQVGQAPNELLERRSPFSFIQRHLGCQLQRCDELTGAAQLLAKRVHDKVCHGDAAVYGCEAQV